MSWIAAAIGAGVGLTKAIAIDKPKENRQRKLAAETIRYSPWTHMQAGPIQEADPLGSTLAFGMTGAQMQQGHQAFQSDQALKGAYTSALNKGAMVNPWGAGPSLGVGKLQTPRFNMPGIGIDM